ncbi:hypothetical protein [Nocardia carnea]|uniref:hypothetical protein n=1 Tax=Nocardia carnea TaxID=37328 RepID=UPI002454FAA7|nr:hypothetical protein [Nocardia carnea]
MAEKIEISLCRSCVYMIGSAANPTPEDIAAAEAMAANWPNHILTYDSGDDSWTGRYCDGCGIGNGIQKPLERGWAIPVESIGTAGIPQ